jgi:hypothetical protein
VEENGPTSTNPDAIYMISAINLVYDTLGAKQHGQKNLGMWIADVDIPWDVLIINTYIKFSL